MKQIFRLGIFALFLSITGFTTVQAQQIQVRGTVADGVDNTPIVGATVTIKKLPSNAVDKSTITVKGGFFRFTDLSKDSFTLTISYIGYERFTTTVFIDENTKNLGSFKLPKKGKALDEVSVTSKVAPTQQKGDTVQYNASQYKVSPDATAEELIKKMPGVTVDKSGTVTAQGEQVRKVTVDGKEFFGDDATAALRNLPAEVIDKIQVFDRLSDQAAFTGFDDGNSVKAMNITTKNNIKNGQFGRVFAGYGTDNRYNVGGNASFLKGNRRISVVGLFNNINQQNFSSQDLLGVTSTSSNSGGGGGRGGNRGGGGTNNFMVGQQNGISATNAFGINYSDQWSKKLLVSGSYFFNHSNTGNNQQSATQYFLNGGNNQFGEDIVYSNTSNQNHRINMRLEYTIDKRNSIIITPNISIQKNASINDNQTLNYFTLTDLISLSDRNTDRNTKGYNIGNNILYRHAFAKRGRTISLNLSTTFNKRTGETYLQSHNIYYKTNININDSLQQFTDQVTNGYQLSAGLVYTEPIGKKGQLQLNYTPTINFNKADQEVYQYDFVQDKYSIFDPSLSNLFDNRVATHNTGVTYRKGDRDNMFAVGVSYQFTQLTSDQKYPIVATVRKPFNNVLPNLMWRKKISSKANLRLMYRANTNVPSVSQLQNVFNNANPLFITTGNPSLKQQYGNVLSARYTFTNTQKGQSFFANVFLQQNNDYITNSTIIASTDSVLTPTVTLFKGSQLSKPVNLNGFVSVRSFLTYGMPIKFIKSNINFNLGFTYARTPGMINTVKSIADNYNYNSGVVISSNISQYIDFNVSYSINVNQVTNSVQAQLNNKSITQSTGLQLNLLSKKGWLLQQDVNNQRLTGLAGGFNQNYWLWNAAIGKKFLKNQAGELKLSVFDLLKQNVSVVRNVTETYIEDQRNLVLQQYFMLTFTYKLKSFGVGVPVGNNPNRMGSGGMGGNQRF
ncbi:MAG: outer membrane beta-barrel protein [Ferruginibacter sp.]